MTEPVRYLETGSHNPYYNLAFEETVLLRRREGTYLILWQNEPTVVVGQNQNTEAEINRPYIDAHRVHVVRRATGGGAVYHDLGNLNYSFIADGRDADQLARERFTIPIAEALGRLGVRAEPSGRNDILAEGRKVSGTARRVVRGRVLHHGTLLFDSDLDAAAQALHADPEKFQSKGVRSVRSRIGNIRPLLREDMAIDAFRAYLRRALSGGAWREDALSGEEREAVETLRREKYDTWEWNYGRSPRYNFSNRRRWEGGSLEVRADVERGHIREIVFYGDFLSVEPLEPIIDALRGCAFRREDAAAALDTFALSDYFGAVTKAEVLDTLFPNG